MKAALLITYYWPPAGGAGVHRWLRFSKYFEENGWDLHVYCPERAAWPITDPKLLIDVPNNVTVIRNRIFEPHNIIAKRSGFDQDGGGLSTQSKMNFKQRMMIWIRGNLFIPDSRMLWINPSTRFLKKYLREHPEISTIISTGPPHSMHVIGLKLKRKLGIKWVADFRDPWTQIDFYDDLLPGKMADRKQKKLEKSVLTSADKVLTVSQSWADSLSKIGQRPVEVITNGYTFPEIRSTSLDSSFSIAHFGSMPFARNPLILWQSLNELLLEIPEMKKYLEIKLVGFLDYQVRESLSNYNLDGFLTHIPNVEHSISTEMQRSAQVLLLIANKVENARGRLPGKLFEYMGAHRPIIAIGESESDLKNIIHHTRSGEYFDYESSNALKAHLRECFSLYRKGMLICDPINLNYYSSKELTKRLIGHIESIK